MSMVIYMAMAFWAAIGWSFNARMGSMLAHALAPTGALMTFLALWTGSFWGRPAWGTWWVWDARLTSELILLFLYLGYMALRTSIDDHVRGDKASALLAIVGAVNVPIIYFSVRWWNTLHQGATISLTAAPKMAHTMLLAMLLMTFALWAYAFAMAFTRASAIALEREQHTDWARQWAAAGAGAGKP
jgi:heme exporter protein C